MPKKKCKLCSRVFVDKPALIRHIDKEHNTQIPQGWSASRYENYLRTGKEHGSCVVCKTDTNWNEATEKYGRLCIDPKCKKILRDSAAHNMIGKYGKVHLLNDPDMQKRMIYGKKNSGPYDFETEPRNNEPVMYDSSYGLVFLEMIDHFLGYCGLDIMGPSPNVYYYMYEGKEHFYIPDFYIPSLNLEIEIKDGGDNPNNHPKILNVDKVKEKLKDDVMISLKGKVNYVKVVNKKYDSFFEAVSRIKNSDDDTKSNVIITEAVIIESLLKDSIELYRPGVGYSSLIDRQRKKIPRLSLNEVPDFHKKIASIEIYLKSVINKTDEEATRMRTDAQKSLDIISKHIMPELQLRENELIKNNDKLDMKYILLNESIDCVDYSPIVVILKKSINVENMKWYKAASILFFDETQTEKTFMKENREFVGTVDGISGGDDNFDLSETGITTAYMCSIPTVIRDQLIKLVDPTIDDNLKLKLNEIVFDFNYDYMQGCKFCSDFLNTILPGNYEFKFISNGTLNGVLNSPLSTAERIKSGIVKELESEGYVKCYTTA
jgi:hypothetical protein